MSWRPLPVFKIDSDLLRSTFSYNDFLEKLEVSDFPHAGAIQMQNDDTTQSFYTTLRSNVEQMHYGSLDKKCQRFQLENNWIFASDMKAPSKEELIRTILKRAEGRFKPRQLGSLEACLQFEEAMACRDMHYCEHKILKTVDAFAPLHKLINRKSELLKSIFPTHYPFNIHKGGSRHELLAQLWSFGNGWTEPWLYVKEPDTFTPKHSDRQASINIFGGEGVSLWEMVPPSSYDQMCKLYSVKAMEDKRVTAFDFVSKQSGPTARMILDHGIDLFYAQQENGDIIITEPRTIHSVHNNCVGLALARTFQCEKYFQHLDEELEMLHQDVFLTNQFEYTIYNVDRLYSRLKTDSQFVVDREVKNALAARLASGIAVNDWFLEHEHRIIKPDQPGLQQLLSKKSPASSPDENLACMVCGQRYSNMQNVRRHERNKCHFDRDQQSRLPVDVYKCGKCSKSFAYKQLLNQHYGTISCGKKNTSIIE